MEALLKQKTNGKELIGLASDIALILHSLKLNQRQITLDKNYIRELSNKLNSINKI